MQITKEWWLNFIPFFNNRLEIQVDWHSDTTAGGKCWMLCSAVSESRLDWAEERLPRVLKDNISAVTWLRKQETASQNSVVLSFLSRTVARRNRQRSGTGKCSSLCVVNKVHSDHRPGWRTGRNGTNYKRESEQGPSKRSYSSYTYGGASGTMHAGSAIVSACGVIGLGVTSTDELEVLISKNTGCGTGALMCVYYKQQTPVGWVKLRTYYRDGMVSVWWISGV